MSKGRFRVALENWWDETDLETRFTAFTQRRADAVENITVENTPELLALLKNGVEDIPQLREFFNRETRGNRFIGVIVIVPMVIGVVMAAMQAALAPILTMITYKIANEVQFARFTLPESIQIAWRGRGSLPEPLEDIGDLGWIPERVKVMEAVLRPRLPVGELIAALRREFMTEQEFDTELLERGYLQSDIDNLKSLSIVVPAIPDLIGIAVREGFSPAAIAQGELFKDFPQELATFGAAHGLTEDWARLFWVAHWRLPGIQEAFEMHHRLRGENGGREFSIEALKTFLVSADIAPGFHDNLIEIAFARLTRVDIRRAVRDGSLSVDKVLGKYKDLGYDDENAQILTDIAVNQNVDNDRDLTLGIIKQAYQTGGFTREEAQERIENLGFDFSEADIILDLIDYRREQERIKDETKLISLQFDDNELTEAQLRTQLSQTGLELTEVNIIVERLTAKRKRRVKIPSQSMLDDFYEEDIITRDVYKSELTKRGWTNQRISWITDRLELDIQKRAEREAERARRDLARLEGQTERREFSLAKAIKDVAIREFMVEIADLKVALKEGLEDEDKDEIKISIEKLKVDVANERLDKANITRERLEN